MNVRNRALVTLGVAVLVLGVWRRELYTVQAPGDAPRPLALLPATDRPAASFDVQLPRVPVGSERVRSGGPITVVHYWAPWQLDATRQATDLDSLRRTPESRGLRIVIVCSDPFPSVARYVARRRLGVTVVLDRSGALKSRLPCPSIPYTYVIDRAGRIVVRQAGEVDWLSPRTRRVLQGLLEGDAVEGPSGGPSAGADQGSGFTRPICQSRNTYLSAWPS